MAKTPRPYQQEAVSAIFDYFNTGNTGNPIIVAPTGAGKSLLIADFIKRAHQEYPTTKFMVVSHVVELLTQNAQELNTHWPFVSTCFYSAGLNKKSLYADVIFAGIQSIYNKANKIYNKANKIKHKIDLLLVDECHLIPRKGNTQYRKFISDMQAINPAIKVIGFSATPYRSESGYLHHGADRLFTDIIYDIKIPFLIENKYLCNVVTPRMETQMDVSKVKISNGDFVQTQLAEAVDKKEITQACCREIVAHGANRKSWLIFSAGVQHGRHIEEELTAAGVPTKFLDATSSDRDEVVRKFKDGTIRALVNVGLFTTGFNHPAIDLVALCRPCRSPVLYQQMVGRGLRTSPGKIDCTVLDFGGTIDALGPIDNVVVESKIDTNGNGEAPTKVCPNCFELCHAGVRHCPECDYEFERKLKITRRASQAAILTNQIPLEEHVVQKVYYSRYDRTGKESIFAKYVCEKKQIWKWYFFNFPHDESVQFWLLSANTDPPKSVSEFLARKTELRIPAMIKTRKEGKYDQIKEYIY